MDDLYKTLGVVQTASDAEIKSAYRKLAKQYHPDLNAGNAEKFKQLSGAYDILSDSVKRGKYDRGELDPSSGHDKPGSGFWRSWNRRGGAGQDNGFQQPYDIKDFVNGEEGLFGDIFRSAYSKAGRQNQKSTGPNQNRNRHAANNTKYKLKVPFLEAVLGVRKRVTLSDGKIVEMTIPSGSISGTKLRLKGQGRLASDGVTKGDAVIELNIDPHECFTRHDQDIRIDIPVTLHEAILGLSITVPTIYGDVTLKIPPNSNTGTTLRLKGKGLAKSISNAEGDQYVTLLVTLPDSVDDGLKHFIQKWGPPKGYNPRRKMKLSD